MKALVDAVAPKTWHGIWPGRVVNDMDPTKDGLVRVRVEQVYGDPDEEDEYIPDAALPWARVITMGGPGTGQEWTPPVGARVLVGFWAGDGERPFVLGGYHPPKATPDHRLPEHVSSYDNGPKTRIIRTEGGQVFEMRWKKGEAKIRLRTSAGHEILMDDPAEEGGPFIQVTTPGGYRLRLDEKEQYALLETPGGRRVRLDDKAGQMKALMETPTQRVLLDDVAQRAEMRTPLHHVILDDPGVFAEMATPLRRARLDDTAGTADVTTPLRTMKLDDTAQSAELTTPTQTVKLDDAASSISVITPGAVFVTAGGAATVAAAGLATISGSAVVQASTSPGGTALTTAAGLAVSTFTGLALYNFLGALTMAVTGAWLLTVTGLATIQALGVLSLFGSAVQIGTLVGIKRRLLDERFATAVYNNHTHIDSMAGPTTGPILAWQVGPTPPQTPIASVATSDVTAS